MAANSDSGGGIVFAIIALAVLYSCSQGSSEDEQYVADELGVSTEEASSLLDEYGDPDDAIDDYRDASREAFDEDAARSAAEDELASEGYDYSYGCTDDCSGHEAGWQWRAEHGYSTPGYSNSFDEGGRAFDEAVEERVDEMRSDYEAGEEPDY
jgi:hypothetical protein